MKNLRDIKTALVENEIVTESEAKELNLTKAKALYIENIGELEESEEAKVIDFSLNPLNTAIDSSVKPAYQATLASREETFDFCEMIVTSKSKEPVKKEGSQWFGMHILNIDFANGKQFIFTENHLLGLYDRLSKSITNCPPLTVDENGNASEVGTINQNLRFRMQRGNLEIEAA